MTKSFLYILFIFCATSALAEKKLCYEKEVNPLTKRVYSSKENWSEHRADWNEFKPQTPGPFKIIKAFRFYSLEKPYSGKLRGDKAKHCFIGCRVAQGISYEMADFIAWFKEIKDLTDCNRDTAFEPADYEATMYGADHAHQASTRMHCLNVCANMPRF